ncbi:MAG: hypothetical protein IPP57_07165 [Candidatus Obscuribacter sp.]|nr:hypothetical protein [Candidatus Obscuribacter sp.]
MAEGGERTAPLGIAVVGGLSSSLVAVLFVLPLLYGIVQHGSSRLVPSMLVEKTSSRSKEVPE